MADKNYRLTFELSDGSEKSVQFAVPQGEKGEKGDKGENGEHGSAGRNGVSATHSWNGTVLTVSSASGTSSADLKGETGSRGESGVYILASGQTIADAPMDANVVIDPFGGTNNSFLLAPQSAAVGQTLVVKEVDGEGKPIQWVAADLAMSGAPTLEELLLTEIVPETEGVYDETGGMFYLTDPIDLELGAHYVVTLNGVDYPSESFPNDMGIALINEGANLETFEGVTFFLVALADPESMGGFTAMLMLLDGAASASLSIRKYSELPAAVLPQNQYFFQMIREADGTWATLETYDSLAEKVNKGICPIVVIEQFGYNNQTIHAPFAVLDEGNGMIAFQLTAMTLPFKDKDDSGFYLLTFGIHRDGTTEAYATHLNLGLERI